VAQGCTNEGASVAAIVRVVLWLLLQMVLHHRGIDDDSSAHQTVWWG